ncbi:ROK family transcriptional regulator [Cohnella candidum]|uniref:ROK family transcriptional regulator n=1 Tax=Cohnella candidum TaxID=2674991 RepID=A0A3G3JVD4_9BACL|nr:ROK family transcriptional regulator [Cohnella candidum]AYQ72186.1 ROK family transcriptional regulator [Cohnella candidum]
MIDTKGKNIRHVKNLNRNIVLAFIRNQGPITKVEVAARTHLSFTAINNIVDELIQENLIMEAGYDISSGGRKPILLDVNPDGLYTVGIHLSASAIKAAVINFKGSPVVQEESKLGDPSDREALIHCIVQAVQSILDASGIPKEKFAGIGFASPGPLDPNKGTILSPPNIPGLAYVPIRDILEERFGMQVLIEKDANVMALSELWYGAAQGLNSIIYVDADVGIGSGIIFNRKIYQGFPYGAGEIGHGTIELDGPKCNCGNYGCLEAVASGMAIVRRAGEEIRRGVSSELSPLYLEREDSVDLFAIIRAARREDALAVNLLKESARYVGIALANVINMITPESIVIGGYLVNEYPPYFDQLKEVALPRCFASFHKDSMLQSSSLKHQAGVIGAGTLGLERFLSSGF